MTPLLPLLALLHVVLGAGTPQERLDPEPAGENYFGIPPSFGTSASLLFARQQPYVCTDPTSRESPLPSARRESAEKKDSRAVCCDTGEVLCREHVLCMFPAFI